MSWATSRLSLNWMQLWWSNGRLLLSNRFGLVSFVVLVIMLVVIYNFELIAAIWKLNEEYNSEITWLGDETSRWIKIGNGLHKLAVVSGVVSWISLGMLPKMQFVWTPLAGTSLLAYGMYQICWATDPCCKYQIEKDAVSFFYFKLVFLGGAGAAQKRCFRINLY